MYFVFFIRYCLIQFFGVSSEERICDFVIVEKGKYSGIMFFFFDNIKFLYVSKSKNYFEVFII